MFFIIIVINVVCGRNPKQGLARDFPLSTATVASGCCAYDVNNNSRNFTFLWSDPPVKRTQSAPALCSKNHSKHVTYS